MSKDDRKTPICQFFIEQGAKIMVDPDCYVDNVRKSMDCIWMSAPNDIVELELALQNKINEIAEHFTDGYKKGVIVDYSTGMTGYDKDILTVEKKYNIKQYIDVVMNEGRELPDLTNWKHVKSSLYRRVLQVTIPAKTEKETPKK